jgi:hypothetical protein
MTNNSWKEQLRKPLPPKVEEALKDVMNNNTELTISAIERAIMDRAKNTRISRKQIRDYLRGHPNIIEVTLSNGSKLYRKSR